MVSYNPPTFSPFDRSQLAVKLGEHAEAIVFAHGACKRSVSFPYAPDKSFESLLSRFDESRIPLAPQLAEGLLMLTTANELDILLNSESGSPAHRQLLDLLVRWQRSLPDLAARSVGSVLTRFDAP